MRRSAPRFLVLVGLLSLTVGCSSVDSGEAAEDLTTVASPYVEPILPPTVNASYGAPAYRWPAQVVPPATAGAFPPAASPTVAPPAEPLSTAATMGEAPFRTTPIAPPPPPAEGFLSAQVEEEAKADDAPQGSAPVK